MNTTKDITRQDIIDYLKLYHGLEDQDIDLVIEQKFPRLCKQFEAIADQVQNA